METSLTRLCEVSYRGWRLFLFMVGKAVKGLYLFHKQAFVWVRDPEVVRNSAVAQGKPQWYGNHQTYANYYSSPVHIKYLVLMLFIQLGRRQISRSRLNHPIGTRMSSTVVGDYSGRLYTRTHILQHNHADDRLCIFKAE